MAIEKKCNYCGNTTFETKKIDYLYSHHSKYLLAQKTPVEICPECGMIYYEASVLKEIEKHFFAIQDKSEKPEQMIEMPAMHFASPCP